MTSEEGCSASNTEIVSSDVFQNRRLSEVVAQMLDSDLEDDPDEKSDDSDHYKHYKNARDFEYDLIEYCKEPRNKELHRDTMQSIQELESDSILAVDNISVVDSTGAGPKFSTTYNNETFNQNIETTYGTSVETMFGINLIDENIKGEIGEKLENETEIWFDSENEDKRVRWSVTSV